MGQGVMIMENPYVETVTCPNCGSLLIVATELTPFVEDLPWIELTKSPQYCKVCGADLGIEGYGHGILDQTTPQAINCPSCEAALILYVSPTAERNVDQFCPVCGAVAD